MNIENLKETDFQKRNFIVSAGVKYIPTGEVFEGARHGFCFRKMEQKLGERKRQDTIQGFVTAEGKFFDREQARELILETNQFTKEREIGEVLYSENIR